MQKLLELFMHAPSNDHQSTFLEYEAEMLMNNASYSYNQSKMRGAVIDWVNEQLPFSEVTCSPSGFSVSNEHFEGDYSWSEADMLVELVEAEKEKGR